MLEKFHYLKSICLALQNCTVETQLKYNWATTAPARMRVNDSLIKKRMRFHSDLKTYQRFRNLYTTQKDQQLAVE